MLFYSTPTFSEGDVDSFLMGVARAMGSIKKGGSPDTTAACRLVLRDWATGKLPRYTLPPTDPASISPATSDALMTLKTRQEMRATSGLVKLRALEIEHRLVDLEHEWFAAEGDGSSEERDDIEKLAEDQGSENGESMDSEEDNERREIDEDPTPSSHKRKLKTSPLLQRPTKKVAFAEEPKDTKQARSAAGAQGHAKAKTSKVPAKNSQASKKPASDRPPNVVPTAANRSSKHLKHHLHSTSEEQPYDFSLFFSAK